MYNILVERGEDMELVMTSKLIKDYREYNKANRIRQVLEEENPEALLADGLDNALVGVYRPRWTEELPIAVYSLTKTISELVQQGMDEEEAVEYFDYNIEGAYMGDYTPMFVDDTGV